MFTCTQFSLITCIPYFKSFSQFYKSDHDVSLASSAHYPPGRHLVQKEGDNADLAQVVATKEMSGEVDQEQKQEHNLELELHQEVDQKRKKLPLFEYFDS